MEKLRPRKTLPWQPLPKPQGWVLSAFQAAKAIVLTSCLPWSLAVRRYMPPHLTSALPDRLLATGWRFSVYGAVCFIYTFIHLGWSWAPPCRSEWCWVSSALPSVQAILSILPSSPLASSHNWSICFSHTAQDLSVVRPVLLPPSCGTHLEGPSHSHAAGGFISHVRALTVSGQGMTIIDSWPGESQNGITLVLVVAMSLCIVNSRTLHASSLLVVPVTLIHLILVGTEGGEGLLQCPCGLFIATMWKYSKEFFRNKGFEDIK